MKKLMTIFLCIVLSIPLIACERENNITGNQGKADVDVIETIAGINAETINNKADIDAQNFNATGKSYLAGIGMPSTTYDDLTMGATDTAYTAPANGYVALFCKANTQNGWYGLNTSRLNIRLTPTEPLECAFFVPVRKNENFSIQYSGLTFNFTSQTFYYFRFVYAVGEE